MRQLEWNHTLTLHMRSRTFPSRLAHAETTRVLAGLAAIARGEPNPFKQESKARRPCQVMYMRAMGSNIVIALSLWTVPEDLNFTCFVCLYEWHVWAPDTIESLFHERIDACLICFPTEIGMPIDSE